MELTVAKMVGTGVIDTVAKMGETLHDKNGWNWCYRHRDKNGLSSPWQKCVELTMTKMGGTTVIDTMTKKGGAYCGKNG